MTVNARMSTSRQHADYLPPCAPMQLQLLSRFNRESVLLRLMFLGNAKRGGPSHTVLLTDVPGISEVGTGQGAGRGTTDGCQCTSGSSS